MRAAVVLFWLSTTTALRAPAPRVARPRPAAAAPLPVAEAPTSARVAPIRQPMHALTATERATLDREGAVERRSRQGRVGRALVVVDSALAPEAAWAAVRDVATWPKRMRGVKRARVTRTSRGMRAGLSVTKLRLPANLVLTEEDAPSGDARVLRFSLDRDRANVALEAVDGAWRVAPRAGGGSRVSLEAEVGACAIVPASLVDAVAEKALQRATAWLRS